MHITAMVHININCRNFEASRAFYEMLGFKVFWPVPPTNTEAVNRAVGMQDYRVNGALMSLQGANPPMVIDLLEWQSPRDDSAPYPNLHRPGLARLAMASSDLQADYQFLLDNGVEVLSEPATVMIDEEHGSSFFCFKDPDGTFLELVQSF